MKELIIKQIQLRNFKGIRESDITLNNELTKILGCNGAGKSTLADAVSYCLFGKDSKGNAQFGLKTRDEEGNEIPHLEHEASLVVLIDGVQHKLSRILREKWSKPRGSNDEILTGNVIDYYIDDEKVTKTDYDKYVFSIAGEEIFRLLTIPSHFPTLAWQTQLEKLSAIVGDITNEDIAGEDNLFKDLLAELKQSSLEAHQQHLKYIIREIKKKIDEMPVRIDSHNKALPLKLDWDACQKEINSLTYEYNKVGEEIYSLKNGNQESVNRHRVEFLQSRIDNIEKSKRYALRCTIDKHDVALRTAKNEWQDAEDLVKELTRKRMSLDSQINQCNQSIKELKQHKQSGAEEWNNLASKRFVAPEDITICPTCHQYLPEDLARQAVLNARNEFNTRLASQKEQLAKQAERINRELEQADALKEDSIAELKETSVREGVAAKVVIEKRNAFNTIQSEELPTIQSLLDADENYLNLVNEMKQILNPADGDNEQRIATLSAQQAELQSRLSQLQNELASKEQYERVTKLIEDDKALWRSLNQQLTDLERQQDIARQFSERRDSILEHRVNSLFKFTRFKLYKTQVDGVTREPFCTATLNGVEYKDLNNAAKIAVGLDIINALSRYYDVAVPVVVDNAEACNNIPETIGQQILLYVSTNSELTIL